MDYFLQLLMGGLTRGSIYALLALGYTMVYGIVQLINFAHGEIYMVGAFTALISASILNIFGAPMWLVTIAALVMAVVFASGYGYALEKIAYKPLRNAPRLSALITAIGMSLILQNFVQVVQTERFLRFPTLIPEIGFLEPVKHILRSSQLVIMLVTVAVMVVLTIIVKHTKAGKAMRATSQDKTMALLTGVNVNRVISNTFIIGSVTAAIGGILISSHTGQINTSIGFLAGLKAFVAAVLGGIGSIPGAVVGSFVLGFTESFGTGYISSDYEDVFAFLILILVLIFKPGGILGKATKQKV